jgi:hypothetical protein
MDEVVKSKGLAFQTAIYFLLGLLMAPLGAGALASYPDSAWYLGLMFSISSILFLYSAFSNLRKSRLKDGENRIRQLDMEVAAFKDRELKQKNVSTEPDGFATAKSVFQTADSSVINARSQLTTDPTTSDILANWNYSADEWKAFQNANRSVVARESVVLILLITAVGGWILHDDKGEGWLFSFAFCFVFAVLFILLKNYLKKGFINVNTTAGVSVIIDREKLLLNGKLFSFRDEERTLEKAEIIDKRGIKMIEFSYGWRTRGGRTVDEIRIPVPQGKMDEAEKLVRNVI